MGLNPMVYIVVSAICAGVAVFTAFFALKRDRADVAVVAPEIIDRANVAVVSGYEEVVRDSKSVWVGKVYKTSPDIHRTGQRTRRVTSIQDYQRLKGNEENGQSAEAAVEARLG
jgi:hypothetical protein